MNALNSTVTLEALPPPPPDKAGWPWTVACPQFPTMMSDGRSWPCISIVTPSYNQGQFIEETIRSVLLQGYPNLEYIIIDGDSTDESVEIICKYEPWLAHHVSEPDHGQADALTKGFTYARGQILVWLNSDDLFCPGALECVASYWYQHPDCHFLTGDGEFVDPQAEKQLYYIQAGNFSLPDLLQYHRGHYLPQPAVFFSREAFEQVGRLDPSLTYTMDLDLWLRLRHSYRLLYLPMCLAKLRYHRDAKTWRNNALALHEAYRVVSRYTGNVGWRQRFGIYLGFKAALSRAQCQRGMYAYYAGHRAEAVAAMVSAFQSYPAIMCSRAGLQLFLRLIFPNALKRKVFQAP